MTTVLLTASVLMLFLALPLLAYLMLSERRSFHGIWKLAIDGHRVARIYVVLVVLAFALALVAQLIALIERHAERAASTQVQLLVTLLGAVT